jgi:hypothetical protein
MFVTLGFSGGIDEDYIAGLFILWAVLSTVLSRGLAIRAKRALSREMRRLASGDAFAKAGAARQGLLVVQSEGPKFA